MEIPTPPSDYTPLGGVVFLGNLHETDPAFLRLNVRVGWSISEVGARNREISFAPILLKKSKIERHRKSRER